MIFALIIEIFMIAYAIRCVTIGSTWEVHPVEIIIDDRPYAPDPAREGQQLWITAEKIGKNGNVKKRVIWETAGGELTAGLIEGLKQSTACSCVRITIAAYCDGGYRPSDYCKNGEDFARRVYKMMK